MRDEVYVYDLVFCFFYERSSWLGVGGGRDCIRVCDGLCLDFLFGYGGIGLVLL